MEEIDSLRRAYSRIAELPEFNPGDRIWWIYMRNAAIEVVSRGDYPDLKSATDLVKAFPENLANEGARWLELRQVVMRLLERKP